MHLTLRRAATFIYHTHVNDLHRLRFVFIGLVNGGLLAGHGRRSTSTFFQVRQENARSSRALVISKDDVRQQSIEDPIEITTCQLDEVFTFPHDARPDRRRAYLQ